MLNLLKDYDDLIDIRSIQQYLYCPHRWGLIEINCSFAENVFVARGNMVHERVNSNDIFSAKGTIHQNAVKVYNDEWGIYGVLDCLEFKKDKNGTYVNSLAGNYQITIVEYKVTAPKDDIPRFEDEIQVLAQKICIDNLLKTDCECYFYYANTKKRCPITFTENHHKTLEDTLLEIKKAKENGIIPPIRKNQKCSGCSMKDICLPIKREV